MVKFTKAYKKLREFENYMAGEKKNCENKCVFCFIDQLPKNCLRESLYCKDDDERLSFLHGNYITLTNLEDCDIERIIKMRVSPINISVHTTNPDLRVKMMNNKRAGEVLDYIKKLAENNININAQIVVCKNINDGGELERTLRDLCMISSIRSIAVVPGGLTKYRDENNLYKLEPLDKTDCGKIIETIDKFGEENLKKYNSRLVYCADEFYLKAGLEIPDSEYYEDYPQYENGVGMIRSFCDDFYGELKQIVGRGILDAPSKIPLRGGMPMKSAGWSIPGASGMPRPTQKPRKISLVTGEAAYGVIKTLADDLAKKIVGDGALDVPPLKIEVYKIKNSFFGEEITVAGLVTGGDIIEQLTPYKDNLGDELLIPAVMLRYERDLFLDNTSVGDIENALGVRVRIVENNAEDFIKAILGDFNRI